jgi:hypothetical protein
VDGDYGDQILGEYLENHVRHVDVTRPKGWQETGFKVRKHRRHRSRWKTYQSALQTPHVHALPLTLQLNISFLDAV